MPCRFTSPLSPAQGRLTSRFGIRPARRPPHAPTFHAGIDLGIRGAPAGTVPVYAVAPGVIQVVGRTETSRGPFDGYGNCVAVRHAGVGPVDPVWTFYAHMARLVNGVEDGAPVAAGTVLGFVGNTTNGKFPGMGVHLHFEVRRARNDGSSPLPGPYRVLNLDPIPWLAQLGVTFSGPQIVLTDPACPPPVA